uniref:Uncharacterized protein n=1 Tax=Talaromyces marneffei PM1 TaxID=1077442 RepID=A0A093USN3_TALMA
MNILNTILKTYYSGGDKKTLHTLKRDAGFLGRTLPAASSSKFHIFEPLIMIGFHARIVMLFNTALEETGLLAELSNANRENSKELGKVITGLGPDKFLSLINKVYNIVFTY